MFGTFIFWGRGRSFSSEYSILVLVSILFSVLRYGWKNSPSSALLCLNLHVCLVILIQNMAGIGLSSFFFSVLHFVYSICLCFNYTPFKVIE